MWPSLHVCVYFGHTCTYVEKPHICKQISIYAKKCIYAKTKPAYMQDREGTILKDGTIITVMRVVLILPALSEYLPGHPVRSCGTTVLLQHDCNI